MTDTVSLLEAVKAGYEFFKDEDSLEWYKKGTKTVGPFETLDEAVYDALADRDINSAYKFWKGKQ